MIRRRPSGPGKARVAVVAIICWSMLSLTGCGDEGAKVDKSLRSTATTAFKLTPHEGKRYVVGHGVVLEVPRTWKAYTEKDSMDNTTFEWAVSEPDRKPIPSYVQFSMGKKGKGAPFEDLPEASRELGELDSTFKLLDEGKVDIPGAEAASFLRFNIAIDYQGAKVPVEQVQLYLKMPEGEVSTLRFIAAKGEWSKTMKNVYDSLAVAESDTA